MEAEGLLVPPPVEQVVFVVHTIMQKGKNQKDGCSTDLIKLAFPHIHILEVLYLSLLKDML